MSVSTKKWKVIGPKGCAVTSAASRESASIADLPRGMEMFGTGRSEGDRIEIEIPPEVRSNHKTGWVSLKRSSDGLPLIELATPIKSPVNSPTNSMRTYSMAGPAASEGGFASVRSGSPNGMCGYRKGEDVWSLINIQQQGELIVPKGAKGTVERRHESTYGKLCVKFSGKLCNVFATSITNKPSAVGTTKSQHAVGSAYSAPSSQRNYHRPDSSRSSRSTSDTSVSNQSVSHNNGYSNGHNAPRRTSSTHRPKVTRTDYNSQQYNNQSSSHHYNKNTYNTTTGGHHSSRSVGGGYNDDVDPIQQLLERDPTASRIVASLSAKYISGVLDDVGYEEALESVLGDGFRDAIRQRVSAERPRAAASPSPYRATSIPSPHLPQHQQQQQQQVSIPRYGPSVDYYDPPAHFSPSPPIHIDDFPAQTPSSVQREVARLQDTDPAKFKIFQDISKGYLAGTLPADKYRLALSELFGQSASPARSRAGYSTHGTPRRVSPPRR